MQMVAFIVFIFTFLFLSYFYLVRCLSIVFKPKNKYMIRFVIFFYIVTIAAGFFGGRIFRNQKFIPEYFHIIVWVSYSFLALLLLMIVSFFTVDCFLIVKKIFYAIKRKNYIEKLKKLVDEENINKDRRRFFFVIAFAVSFCLTGRAFFNARRVPQVKQVFVPIQNLHPDLKSLSIVQITDLHVGQTIGKEYVESVVEKINELKADIIVITGDLVDGFVSQLTDWVAPLGGIKSKRGLFYVNGNHEYYWDAKGWARYMEELGYTFLENEHRLLKIGRAQLVIGGVTDLNADRFDIMQKSNPKKSIIGAPKNADLKILLAHQPNSAFSSAELDYYDLQLSGHTHGGQLWPGSWLIRLLQPFHPGLTLFNKMWVYVSRGTGYWGPPARLDADSEITLIQFRES
ncbi:metallophosphoesterase [Fluviispira multicolorata]|uniref:Metallophosphoesterase n=1 Tax=Fluviispira multicolorata TaxID=2654512 RepID=A0A833N542_9BACT|nr:metallophosphoesterase [Fluviispira multicolorata]KAB8033457.1 metallophosphoesterase [Fluviispira multicolorata]